MAIGTDPSVVQGVRSQPQRSDFQYGVDIVRAAKHMLAKADVVSRTISSSLAGTRMSKRPTVTFDISKIRPWLTGTHRSSHTRKCARTDPETGFYARDLKNVGVEVRRGDGHVLRKSASNLISEAQAISAYICLGPNQHCRHIDRYQLAL